MTNAPPSKDVAYQMRTPDFWNSMDMIGGKQSYEVWGSFFDGKGQPGQVNAVSHGSVLARFRNVNVINTGRTLSPGCPAQGFRHPARANTLRR